MNAYLVVISTLCPLRSEQMRGCLRLGSALWSLDSSAWSEEGVATHGHQPDQASSCARTESAVQHVSLPQKVSLKNFFRSSETWFHKLANESKTPNAEQLQYLRDIKNRCEVEVREEEIMAKSKSKHKTSEPYRKGLLGPPGTGKSECLRWTRRFFEEVMGWTDGVQFQMVAPQHTMALLIGGRTVHAWGQVPINATGMQEGRNKSDKLGVDELFERTQSLRWLIIDEIEALAAVVFGILHGNLCRAMSRSPYAKRADGSLRPFGGVNLSLSGDWWQLPPVKKIGFYSNPFSDDMDYSEQLAMSFFWRASQDGIQGTHELVQPNRARDKWLQDVLEQDRQGCESWEVYCFTHGLPTKHVGSWLPSKSLPTCGSPECVKLSAE